MTVQASASAELKQLQTLVERMPSAVVTVERDLSLVDANAAARRLFRPERLRRRRKLPPLWFDPDLPDFVGGLFQSGVGPQRREVRPDPDHAFVVVGVPPGAGSTALLLIDDVSLQEPRTRAQQEFIANAAHELLTPLTGIVGAAHALEAGAKAEPELRDRFIGHITRECNRLARIARGLLVLARAQSGEQPPRPEIVQLRSLLEDAAEGAGSTGDVTIRCSKQLTAFVDRDLAEQAFTNFIANARRHSGREPVSVKASLSGERGVDIEIADKGGGFELVEGGRVGRRFASGGGPDGGGFGLGLSIATQAVELSGGTVAIRPRDGRGTVVRVELPRGGAADA
ncbi:MAG TPA: HAMP domain-containing sensor histidine kinase [Gaiellaceae bacterium]|nr:HAMP domain-containing sensor histidine kinase [Gaiellaceae bacterium]